MASGIDLAYEQAMKGLAPGTISRVIVLSDGDANVGPHTHEEMLQDHREPREGGRHAVDDRLRHGQLQGRR